MIKNPLCYKPTVSYSPRGNVTKNGVQHARNNAISLTMVRVARRWRGIKPFLQISLYIDTGNVRKMKNFVSDRI